MRSPEDLFDDPDADDEQEEGEHEAETEAEAPSLPANPPRVVIEMLTDFDAPAFNKPREAVRRLLDKGPRAVMGLVNALKTLLPAGRVDIAAFVRHLENEGTIEKFKGFHGLAYRLPGEGRRRAEAPSAPGGSDSDARQTVAAKPSVAPPPLEPQQEDDHEEKTMAKEVWLSTPDAAKFLGLDLRRFDAICARMESWPRGRGVQYSKASLEAYKAENPSAGDEAPAKPKRAAKPRAAAEPAGPLELEVQWLLMGHKLGKLDAEEVVAKLRERFES